jgi:hypothetical protein
MSRIHGMDKAYLLVHGTDASRGISLIDISNVDVGQQLMLGAPPRYDIFDL